MCTAAKEGYHCTIAFVIQMNGIHRVFPNEATVGKEDLEEMGTAMTLDLLEDGTGTMDYDGTVYDLTWDDTPVLYGRRIVTGIDLLAPFDFGIGIIAAGGMTDQVLPDRNTLPSGEVIFFQATEDEVAG